MTASRQLRADIESALAGRIPGALSPRTFPVRQRILCGIPDIDSLLDGGLPFGAISELSGGACSGRTTLAFRIAAQITQQAQVCAWIDATDAFDPESAKANSIDLDRLLWVRCGVVPLTSAIQHGPTGRAAIPPPSSSSGSRNGLHPRSEAIGLDDAVGRFLSPENPKPQQTQPQQTQPRTSPIRQARPGTPGAPNRVLSLASTGATMAPVRRGVQIPTDRLPARRGSQLLELHKLEQHKPDSNHPDRPTPLDQAQLARRVPQRSSAKHPSAANPWSRLDQALRTTDLLLQSGGFGAVILDLGGIAPQAASRIPLATWFRFRAAADRTRTCLLLLTQHPCAQSSAEVSLSVSLPRTAQSPAPSATQSTVMTSLPIKVELHRQRFQQTSSSQQPNQQPFTKVTSIRKGPHRATAAHWSAPTAWAAIR